jgi:hypothetical protein
VSHFQLWSLLYGKGLFQVFGVDRNPHRFVSRLTAFDMFPYMLLRIYASLLVLYRSHLKRFFPNYLTRRISRPHSVLALY